MHTFLSSTLRYIYTCRCYIIYEGVRNFPRIYIYIVISRNEFKVGVVTG